VSTPLAGRVAIVTGTSANIGGGIAVALAEAGARVACLDLIEANAARCRDDVERAGGVALAVACDVTSPDAVAAALAEVEAGLGVPDMLINNATRYDERGLLEMTVDAWRAQAEVILTGTFLCTRTVAQRWVDLSRPGAVLNLISTAGHQGQPGNIGYSTMKSGLLNFTRAAAMDLARYGIRVNSLTPTSTDPGEKLARLAAAGDTESAGIHRDGLTPILRKRQALIPLGRLPRPSDYAAAAVFLCSDAASMITGTDLRVDGGVLARYWGWINEESET
jgi:NAD(P)-dependent dehydrogenase (short-subunit alcohol dehydrogenase family)